jgi:ATP-dependent Clp protease protease subunit
MAKKKPETKAKEKEKELPEGYMEITPEQLVELSGGGMQTIMSIGLAEKLYLEDLGVRLFYLDSEVTSDLLHTVTMQIYKINGIDYGIPEEERTPIVLVINSRGGSVEDGIGLMDAIRQSKTPVIGVCVGYAMSMAFAIYSVCHQRIAMPNSIFMFHDGIEGTLNTATKFADYAAFSPKIDRRIFKMISENSKFTSEYLESIAPHDNYWFADEMVEKGIVDSIIGQDIEMENIFVFMSDTAFCHDCCEEDEGNE